jgi:hypothetical protein
LKVAEPLVSVVAAATLTDSFVPRAARVATTDLLAGYLVRVTWAWLLAIVTTIGNGLDVAEMTVGTTAAEGATLLAVGTTVGPTIGKLPVAEGAAEGATLFGAVGAALFGAWLTGKVARFAEVITKALKTHPTEPS